MVEDLNEVAIRIAKIKGARAVSMHFRFLNESHAAFFQFVGPLIHLLGFGYKETEVVQTDGSLGRERNLLRPVALMQCQAVGSTCEIDILRIGVPFGLELQDGSIELKRTMKIFDAKRHVPYSQHTHPIEQAYTISVHGKIINL
jgi:hypothetical protein